MIWLAAHLARLPEWAAHALQLDSLDLSPNGVPMPQPAIPKSSKELFQEFDKNVKLGRSAIAASSDADLINPGRYSIMGKFYSACRVASVCANGFLNHNVHHRAQLGVYLRLNNIPVPALYGSSADEQGM